MDVTDYQANFESDVWNTFNALGLGYNVFLIHPSNGPTIWCIPPKESKYADFYMDEEIIQELIDKGLVERKDDNLIQDSEARYELTEKGEGLYTQIYSLTFIEGERAFVSKVQPKLK
jgi:hypothetical protein